MRSFFGAVPFVKGATPGTDSRSFKKGLSMTFLRIIGAGAVLALGAALCYGQDSTDIKIIPYGHAAMDFGQVVNGVDHGSDIAHVAFDRIYLGTGLKAQMGAKTTFSGSIEVKAFNEFPRKIESGFTRRYYYYFYLTQAELTRRFDNLFKVNDLQLNIGGGYFPYKYNKNVKNLGEYLFRSTAYPQTLTTEFDFPFARLAGLYARNSFSAGKSTIKFDLLSTINTEWMAIGDLNLSIIASYNFAHIFEIGAGVEFGSIFSADESVTTPTENDATRYVNGTDTLYYTFRGIKTMGRFSIDPKRLLPHYAFFGDQDLIIYGEAALLGVKNYDAAVSLPIWYNSPLERIPVTLGMNWPTHQFLSYCIIPEAMGYYLEEVYSKKKLTAGICGATGIMVGVGSWLMDNWLHVNSKLDILSIECEWWGNRYPNNMGGVVFEGVPLPFKTGELDKKIGIDSTKYKNDNLKWSVFGEKTIANRYRVSFQIANDHMRTFAWDWNRQDWEEALQGPEKWYYMMRFGVLF